MAKAKHLHIRATEGEKDTLTRAARAKNLTVSQFVLQTAMPVAEVIIEQETGVIETHFRLGEEAWAEFNRLLDAPPREIPALRELLAAKAPWQK